MKKVSASFFFFCAYSSLKITYEAIEASRIPGRLETFQIFCLLYDRWWLVIVWQGSGPPLRADHRWWDSLVTITCSYEPADNTTEFNSYWILLVQSQTGHICYQAAVILVGTKYCGNQNGVCLHTWVKDCQKSPSTTRVIGETVCTLVEKLLRSMAIWKDLTKSTVTTCFTFCRPCIAINSTCLVKTNKMHFSFLIY